MSHDLIVPVGDLVGTLGKKRVFSGSIPVTLRLGGTVIDGPMHVEGRVRGLTSGVTTDFVISAPALVECVRCLDHWEETVTVEASQVFRKQPDEDGYRISDDSIDLSGPAQDELALALPAAPLCRPECRGLCPTCGTDLNRDPCDGHGEDINSPFAVLKDLFDP